MNLNYKEPEDSISDKLKKFRPISDDVKLFRDELCILLNIADKGVDNVTSEAYMTNPLRDFLLHTYYNKSSNEVNTGDGSSSKIDLAIRTGNDIKTPIGVIIEVKRPKNSQEMMSRKETNAKALHELIRYYLGERLGLRANNRIQHCIVTNVYEWFIFSSADFYKHFCNQSMFQKEYEDWVSRKTDDHGTDGFYSKMGELLKDNNFAVPCTHFDLNEYRKYIKKDNHGNYVNKPDKKFFALMKVLSPQHLLAAPIETDSTYLDKSFYKELLYIIGLEEVKNEGKLVIKRLDEAGEEGNPIARKQKKECRQAHSLIENTIRKLKTITYLSETQLFEPALELCIIWVNRLLFLKLLEGQLIIWRNTGYKFLSDKDVESFDDLYSLFHEVLAIPSKERDPNIKEAYKKLPYLNSSLFYLSDIEQKYFGVDRLNDGELNLMYSSILKGTNSKGLPTLKYLLSFLDSYDFASEGQKDEKNSADRTIINASVLGKVFEKINGYKDGSYFTPGFITQYMCKETIRLAVLHKFKSEKGWDYQNISDLKNIIGKEKSEKIAANKIINSLKICDPAVGSGHFLVSVLNEIITIKDELNILFDREQNELLSVDYTFSNDNDELTITDSNNKSFVYVPGNEKLQKVQEAIFHEKQAIIENCLFGVDINPKSVQICRLRLWIELLKNAYYTKESKYQDLETLPNIDINIKCGDSLISRYPLNVDLNDAFKKSKLNVKEYKKAVSDYRNAKYKGVKQKLTILIEELKANFRTEISINDRRVKELNSYRVKLAKLTAPDLIPLNKSETTVRNNQIKDFEQQIKSLNDSLEKIRSNKIYENAFEWRFEFPEVLNEDGEFIGFDIVIGNPPYNSKQSIKMKEIAKNFNCIEYKCDPYAIFIEYATVITKKNGIVALITPLTWLTNHYYFKLRKYLIDSRLITQIIMFDNLVFDSANVDTSILILAKENQNDTFSWLKTNSASIDGAIFTQRRFDQIQNENRYEINSNIDGSFALVRKTIENGCYKLSILRKISLGMKLKKNDKYVRRQKDSTHHEPIVFGSEIGYYKPIEPTHFFNYNDAVIIGGTKKLEIHNYKPKIMIQAIRNLSLKRRIVAALDTEGYYFIGTVNALTPSEKGESFNEKYILALINSTLLNYYFQNRFTTISLTSAFLGELPIKDASHDLQKPFIEIVDQILSTKQSDPGADTRKLEQKIDELVYELYGLEDPDEIKIIESSINK